MELTLDQALQKGVAAHKEGKLQEAERLYRAILQAQPKHPNANHNLGVLAVAVDKPLEALPLFQQALEANPRIEQFWLSYIDTLITLERLDEAKRALVEGEKAGVSSEKLESLRHRAQALTPDDMKKAGQGLTLSEKRKRHAEKKKSRRREARGASSVAGPSQVQINNLLRHCQAGRFEKAEPLAVSLTQQFPEHQFGWKVLGSLFQHAGRLDESLAALQKAVDLSPQDPDAHFKLGITLRKLGRLDEAEASYRCAIALKPAYPEAHYNLGGTLKELGKLAEALASFRQSISLKPELAEAHYNLGNTLRQLGSLREAEASYRHAIALNSDYTEAHNNLGNTLQELGKLYEAEASFRQAIALKPDHANAHGNLGGTLQQLGRMREAEASYIQAIELKPDYAEAHRNLAITKKFSRRDIQFSQMESLYQDPTISEDHRCQICFALAKACDDIGELSNAFQFYAEGNALRKKQLCYDKAKDKGLFEKLKASYPFTAEHSFRPASVALQYAPIFIVGMPRSGTTLIEQIISSHPLVIGAGELPFVMQFGGHLAFGQTPIDEQALTTFREQYLKALEQRKEGNTIITDKMPQNFLLLGLISAALPEAKIIHVKRDAAAVCWANYTQYFVNDSLGYCYSLDDILHYYRLYEGLMKFWHRELPSTVYDLDYEILTENQEEETRKLISHLGLEWDDACLSPEDNTRGVATASNVQVRQKVYQGSSHKWKRYRPYLNGALDYLSTGNH